MFRTSCWLCMLTSLHVGYNRTASPPDYPAPTNKDNISTTFTHSSFSPATDDPHRHEYLFFSVVVVAGWLRVQYVVAWFTVQLVVQTDVWPSALAEMARDGRLLALEGLGGAGEELPVWASKMARQQARQEHAVRDVTWHFPQSSTLILNNKYLINTLN